MTEAEKLICKMYLEDLDPNGSCNEYKLLMSLLEKEPADTGSPCGDCLCRSAEGCVYEELSEIIPLEAACLDKELQEAGFYPEGDWIDRNLIGDLVSDGAVHYEDIKDLPSVRFKAGSNNQNKAVLSDSEKLIRTLHLDSMNGQAEEYARGWNNAFDNVIAVMESTSASASNDGLWISVKDRLPEEGINPVTDDYWVYPVTFHSVGHGRDVYDVRYYKFGDGHWWNGPAKMDEFVTAWMDRPVPYSPDRG